MDINRPAGGEGSVVMWKIEPEEIVAAAFLCALILVAMELFCFAITGTYIGQ